MFNLFEFSPSIHLHFHKSNTPHDSPPKNHHDLIVERLMLDEKLIDKSFDGTFDFVIKTNIVKFLADRIIHMVEHQPPYSWHTELLTECGHRWPGHKNFCADKIAWLYQDWCNRGRK